MNSNSKTANNLFQDKNFYVINGVTLIAIMGGLTIAPVLPALAKTFNVSPHSIELVLSIFLFPIAIATPILGVLADRIGRKQILVPSLLLFAISGGFASFAQNFNSLLTWRFFQGLGAASLETLSLTMFSDLYQGKALIGVMSFNTIMIGMSSTLYPLVGGILGGFSWRYPFLLSMFALPIAMLILMVLKLPKPSAQKLKLNLYLKSTWNSINHRSVLGLLFAVAAVFILQFGAILTYIPLLASVTLGAPEWVNGIILCSMSVSVALIASRLGMLASKVSEITLIKLSFIISAVALAITPALHNVWLLLIPTMLFGAAQGLALPSSQALLAGLAAQDSRAGFMAVNATVQAIGQALGPVSAGIAFGLWGMQGVFFASAGFSLIAFSVFNYLLTPQHSTAAPTAHVVPMSSPAAGHATPTMALNLASDMALETTQYPTANTASARYSSPQLASPTILQLQTAQLIHASTHTAINLPAALSVIHIGKPNDRIPPDVDVSEFPGAEVVSRIHADIRVEGDNYYLQDAGSANGTYLNNYPLLPGNWYKLRPGDRISLGKGQLVKFLFQLA
jgi:MFS family permease